MSSQTSDIEVIEPGDDDVMLEAIIRAHQRLRPHEDAREAGAFEDEQWTAQAI